MKTMKFAMIVLCALLGLPASFGQASKAANQADQKGILGYLDPQTGAFRPVRPAVATDEENSGATTFTGTINLTLTITVKTSGLTSVQCEMIARTEDGTTNPTFYSENSNGDATISGSTVKCKMSIPYAWSLTAQATDLLTVSYSVFGVSSPSQGVIEIGGRSSGRSPLEVVSVPANGAVTNLTAAVTL